MMPFPSCWRVADNRLGFLFEEAAALVDVRVRSRVAGMTSITDMNRVDTCLA
jgi:hypothetical protein